MTEGFSGVENMFDDQEKEFKKILKICKMLSKDTLSCANDNDAEFEECFDDTVARSDVNKKIDKESLVTAQFPRVDMVTEAETPLVDMFETEPEPVTILAEARGKTCSALALNLGLSLLIILDLLMPTTTYQSGPVLMGFTEKVQLSVTTISSIDIASQFQHIYNVTGPDLNLWPIAGMFVVLCSENCCCDFFTTHLVQEQRARYANSHAMPGESYNEATPFNINNPSSVGPRTDSPFQWANLPTFSNNHRHQPVARHAVHQPLY
jgi:hypothetical protein